VDAGFLRLMEAGPFQLPPGPWGACPDLTEPRRGARLRTLLTHSARTKRKQFMALPAPDPPHVALAERRRTQDRGAPSMSSFSRKLIAVCSTATGRRRFSDGAKDRTGGCASAGARQVLQFRRWFAPNRAKSLSWWAGRPWAGHSLLGASWPTKMRRASAGQFQGGPAPFQRSKRVVEHRDLQGGEAPRAGARALRCDVEAEHVDFFGTLRHRSKP